MAVESCRLQIYKSQVFPIITPTMMTPQPSNSVRKPYLALFQCRKRNSNEAGAIKRTRAPHRMLSLKAAMINIMPPIRTSAIPIRTITLAIKLILFLLSYFGFVTVVFLVAHFFCQSQFIFMEGIFRITFAQ